MVILFYQREVIDLMKEVIHRCLPSAELSDFKILQKFTKPTFDFVALMRMPKAQIFCIRRKSYIEVVK